jgi:hypothetical protein
VSPPEGEEGYITKEDCGSNLNYKLPEIIFHGTEIEVK